MIFCTCVVHWPAPPAAHGQSIRSEVRHNLKDLVQRLYQWGYNQGPWSWEESKHPWEFQGRSMVALAGDGTIYFHTRSTRHPSSQDLQDLILCRCGSCKPQAYPDWFHSQPARDWFSSQSGVRAFGKLERVASPTATTAQKLLVAFEKCVSKPDTPHPNRLRSRLARALCKMPLFPVSGSPSTMVSAQTWLACLGLKRYLFRQWLRRALPALEMCHMHNVLSAITSQMNSCEPGVSLNEESYVKYCSLANACELHLRKIGDPFDLEPLKRLITAVHLRCSCTSCATCSCMELGLVRSMDCCQCFSFVGQLCSQFCHKERNGQKFVCEDCEQVKEAPSPPRSPQLRAAQKLFNHLGRWMKFEDSGSIEL